MMEESLQIEPFLRGIRSLSSHKQGSPFLIDNPIFLWMGFLVTLGIISSPFPVYTSPLTHSFKYFIFMGTVIFSAFLILYALIALISLSSFIFNGLGIPLVISHRPLQAGFSGLFGVFPVSRLVIGVDPFFVIFEPFRIARWASRLAPIASLAIEGLFGECVGTFSTNLFHRLDYAAIRETNQGESLCQ